MSQTHYILQNDYVNTNLKALRLLNINANQYAYLYIVSRYQEANGGKLEGWCEPMKFNNLYSKTGLKLSIGYQLGMTESGIKSLYKTLIKKGLIEDTPTKFRVTTNFYVCNGELVKVAKPTQNTDETPVKQLKTPNNKPTALKFSYEETEFFKDFTVFKEAALCCRNLPQNVDFKAYFNKLAKYYTTENKNAYTLETWREKVKTWLEQDRTKGNILRLDTEGGLTNEQILKELETYGKIVFFPSETLKYPVYKEHTLTFLEFFEKAKKREILSDEVGQQRVIYANWVNQYVKQNRLGEFFKERKEEENTPKQQKTAKKTENTEGVEVVKMEQKFLEMAQTKHVKNG